MANIAPSENPFMPPPSSLGMQQPRYSIPGADAVSQQDDDTKSVASMDDFEARLAALKRL